VSRTDIEMPPESVPPYDFSESRVADQGTPDAVFEPHHALLDLRQRGQFLHVPAKDGMVVRLSLT
jgi:hypothetical protein